MALPPGMVVPFAVTQVLDIVYAQGYPINPLLVWSVLADEVSPIGDSG